MGARMGVREPLFSWLADPGRQRYGRGSFQQGLPDSGHDFPILLPDWFLRRGRDFFRELHGERHHHLRHGGRAAVVVAEVIAENANALRVADNQRHQGSRSTVRLVEQP